MVNVFGKECTLKSLSFEKSLVPLDQPNVMDGIEFMKLFPDESIPFFLTKKEENYYCNLLQIEMKNMTSE